MINRTSSVYNFYPKKGVGPGALANDEVTHCDVCAELGFPRESVRAFRLPNNGIRLLNYNDGTNHKHRNLEEELEKVWNSWK